MADSDIPAPAVKDPQRAAAVTGTPSMIPAGYTFGSVTDKISSIVLARKTPAGWWLRIPESRSPRLLHARCCIWSSKASGSGVTTSRWDGRSKSRILSGGSASVRGHAHLRDPAAAQAAWRTSINRFAEAMTLFAVACAALFPAFTPAGPGSTTGCCRTGRWAFGRSSKPVMWDVFAVATYARCRCSSGSSA